jgi:Uma2 family endonuclease
MRFVDQGKPKSMSPGGTPIQTVVLRGIQWETYERLLVDQKDRSVPHFYYDRGTLEIMSPSSRHEYINRTLALLVDLLASEFEIDVFTAGSTTFRREDLLKGFEPDSCFYFTLADVIRAKDNLDLNVDPPPDLVIEIEVTNPVVNKLSLYSAVGVREVWVCTDDSIRILQLESNTYVSIAESVFLPRISAGVLLVFLQSSRAMKRPAWVRSVRAWAAGNR